MSGTWENDILKTDIWMDLSNQDKPIIKKYNPLTEQWVPTGATPAGTTAQRPTTDRYIGMPYYDTTLSKPVWWNGSVWKDAMGTTV